MENSLELHGMFALRREMSFFDVTFSHWFFKWLTLLDRVSPDLAWTMRLQARQSMQLKEDVAALQCADVKAGHEAVAHGTMSRRQIYLEAWYWEIVGVMALWHPNVCLVHCGTNVSWFALNLNQGLRQRIVVVIFFEAVFGHGKYLAVYWEVMSNVSRVLVEGRLFWVLYILGKGDKRSVGTFWKCPWNWNELRE